MFWAPERTVSLRLFFRVPTENEKNFHLLEFDYQRKVYAKLLNAYKILRLLSHQLYLNKFCNN